MAHEEQCAILRETIVRPVRKMLDVGAGEGLFTATVLELLLQAGKLEGTLELHILEGEDRLWHICRKRLEETSEIMKGAGITLNISRITTVTALPHDTDNLFIALDRLAKSGESRYDLIVASHVSYYFHDGGIDLAYGIITRLLAKEGLAWFVVRDRNCAFYRLRKKLLMDRGIPDINHHQFADSFTSSLKTLFEGVLTCSRTMSLNLAEVSREAGRRTIEYLTWLDGLGEDELSCFLEEQAGIYINLEFREQHIWLLNGINITRKNEVARLQAAHSLARCLNSVREICPDAIIISASLAEIIPSESNDDIDRLSPGFIQEDHEKPIALKGFGLIRYGYDGDSANPRDVSDILLDGYFREHTSFLYYPRFYIDHTSACPITPDHRLSFHTTDEAGQQGYATPEKYTTRFGQFEKVKFEDSLLEHVPPFAQHLQRGTNLSEIFTLQTKIRLHLLVSGLLLLVPIYCQAVHSHLTTMLISIRDADSFSLLPPNKSSESYPDMLWGISRPFSPSI